MKLNRWNLNMATAVVTLSSAGLMANSALAQNNPTPSASKPNNTVQEQKASQGATKHRDQSVGKSDKTGKASAHDMRASQLIGMDVQNLQGRDLGEINDLMIDVNNQRVRYAILGFGGFMGLGEKLFAYPVGALRTSGDKLVLDVPQERLERAPGFERNLWPDWISTGYRDEVDRHFGPGVAGPDRLENVRLVRASELVDMDVKDAKGDDAGEIEDLVVNFNTGMVRYAVLDFDKAWSLDDKLLALPLNTLRIPTDMGDDAVLQVPRDKLNMKSGFDDDKWPDLNSAQHHEQIDKDLPLYHSWIYKPEQNTGNTEPARARQQ